MCPYHWIYSQGEAGVDKVGVEDLGQLLGGGAGVGDNVAQVRLYCSEDLDSCWVVVLEWVTMSLAAWFREVDARPMSNCTSWKERLVDGNRNNNQGQCAGMTEDKDNDTYS